jgi:signal-transduction protein with cAMP-binding, CBS, and nucleotidyltransferase domain
MATIGTTTSTARDILSEKGSEILTVSGDTTISSALEKMVESKVGAVLVEDGGALAGIWTERDLMRNTLESGFDPTTAQVRQHMTRELKHAEAEESPYELMDKFLGLRLRHLLIRERGEIIGLLSIGDVVRFALQTKTEEFEQLKETVNWEYYEEWRTRPK